MDSMPPESLAPVMTSVRYWRDKEQFLLDEDTHYQWVMFAVESGVFQYEIAEEKGTAERGDLVFCPPFVPLRRTVVKPLTFFVFNFTIPERIPASPGAIDASGGFETAGVPSGKVTIRDMQRLSSDYEYLRSCWERREEPYWGRAQYLLRDIWQLACWEADATSRFSNMRSDPLVVQAERLIREHARSPFSMKQLAARLGLSPVQLTRRFTAAMRITPGAYLASLRMNNARALLVETDLTLDDIARRCGYDNGFYFSRAFSAKMGMPPSRYRKLNRL